MMASILSSRGVDSKSDLGIERDKEINVAYDLYFGG